MNEKAPTPVSIAAMPASFSLLMPKHQRAAAGSSPASPMARSMNSALRDAGAAYPGHAALRELGDAAGAARQQAVEGVDGGAHELVLAAPPAFVTPQDALGARVFARFDALRQHVGQRRGIEQAQVRALPRERMHHVRGVADQRHARA